MKEAEIKEGLEDVKAGRVKSIEEVAKVYGIRLKDIPSKNRT